MAMFCYRDPRDGKIHERAYQCGKAPPKVKLPDGTEAVRCFAAEVAGQGGMQPSTWPLKSNALAVHPTQRMEYQEFSGKHGVPTDFDSRGRPVFRSKEHRKQYCELVGATDFDGGYGDPYSGRKGSER